MKAYKRLTDDEVRAAHAAYMGRATYRELSAQYGVAEDTLLDAFRPLGLRGHTSGVGSQKGHQKSDALESGLTYGGLIDFMMGRGECSS